MIGAWKVQGIVAEHAVPADQDIDLAVIQHVANVQRAGDIGRRNDDGKNGAGGARVGTVKLLIDPGSGPVRLDQLGIVGLGKIISLGKCERFWGLFGHAKHLKETAFTIRFGVGTVKSDFLISLFSALN